MGVALASAQCRAGLLPAAPAVVAWNDSVIDPSRAPPGKHLKKFVVLGVPYEIRGDAAGRIAGRDWDSVKEAYADLLIDRIARDFMPELKQRLLARVAHSPLDMERMLGAVRGTLGQGSLLPWQSGAMRPIPALHGYRTPVPNVYLASSGAHPGPGISMVAGRNAAQVIASDLGLDFARPVSTAT